LKDSLIEEDLGIDGISESVLIVTGSAYRQGRRISVITFSCGSALQLLARTMTRQC